jgi:hypothetical protein
MKVIDSVSGIQIQIDDEDYVWASQFKWYKDSHGYAYRNAKINGRWTTVRMHRELLNAPCGMDVDHIDGNILNNQRSNLRVCSHAQNCRNVTIRKNRKTSQYKGVSIDSARGCWQAYVGHRNIGRFNSEREAALAYNVAAQKYFGEFARLNAV